MLTYILTLYCHDFIILGRQMEPLFLLYLLSLIVVFFGIIFFNTHLVMEVETENHIQFAGVWF